MNKSFFRTFTVKVFAICFYIIITLISFDKLQLSYAFSPKNIMQENVPVIEHLRLKVSENDRQAWLLAEQKTWEPWLKKQDGFIGRDLFWDPINEEATLLISWASREDWAKIPQLEIDNIQQKFEILAKEETGKKNQNPFPLKFQGELLSQ